MTMSSPFFIVGSSRSGTTLLRLIMAGHSKIHIPPETWFILQLVQRFSLDRPLSAAEATEALAVITTHFRWGDLGLDAGTLSQGGRSLEHPFLVDIVNLVFESLLIGTGKQRIGDKTPLYIGIVPELAALFPQARFIHLIRDGRDVAISFIDAGFHERCYDGDRFEWIPAIRKGLAYRTTPLARLIKEVRYDDLVTSPERTVRDICEFLDEAFEPQMLEYSARMELVPVRGHKIHRKLRQPISTDGIDMWRRKLSAIQCFVMEACLHGELTRLGYSLRFGAAPWRPLLFAGGLLLRGLSPLLDRIIPFLQRCRILPKPFYL